MKKKDTLDKFSEGLYAEYIHNFHDAIKTIFRDNAMSSEHIDVEFDYMMVQELLHQMYERYHRLIRIPDLRINFYPTGYFSIDNLSIREDRKYFKK